MTSLARALTAMVLLVTSNSFAYTSEIGHKWEALSALLTEITRVDSLFEEPLAQFTKLDVTQSAVLGKEALSEAGCRNWESDFKSEKIEKAAFLRDNGIEKLVSRVKWTGPKGSTEADLYALQLKELLERALDEAISIFKVTAGGDCARWAFDHNFYIFEGIGFKINIRLSSFAD